LSIFDKIGDILGDVVDGVVDFVDDVFNIDLKKVLNNKWVKYGLMAASIFTGGVAIVNGVIQGAGAAASAKGFMASFVDGAAGFVKGAASGLVNPMKTAQGIPGDVGKLLSGDFAGLSGSAGDAARAATMAAGEQTIAGTPADLLSGGSEALSQTGVDALGNPALSKASAFDPAGRGFGFESAPDVMTDSASKFGDLVSGRKTDLVRTATDGGGTTDTESPGFFAQMAGGAKEFAASPAGMRTLTGAAQGWAAGQQREEELKRIQKQEERRRGSWQGFGDRTNSVLSGQPLSLQQLRDRRQQTMNRGNQAQALYGN